MISRYQRPKNREWIDFTWRYDSGLVVSGVPDVDAALTFTPSEQVASALPATAFRDLQSPIRTCSGVGKFNSLTLPQTGTENDDHNPDRVKPRNLFDVGIGTDNLFHKETGPRWTLVHRGKRHQQSGAVQFSFHLQRHAFYRAAQLSGHRRLRVLRMV